MHLLLPQFLTHFCSSHEGRLRDNFVISFKKHYVLVETFCSSIPYFIFMLNEFVIFQFVSQMVRVWSIKKKAQWVIQWVKGGTHTGVPEMSESRDVFALKTAYTHLWQFIIHCLVTGTSVWCRSCSHCVWTWSNKKKQHSFPLWTATPTYILTRLWLKQCFQLPPPSLNIQCHIKINNFHI